MKQSDTEKFFRGISVQTSLTIIMGVMEIGVFSVMSRLLSKEEFGYMAVLTAITTIFYSISEAGLGSAIIQKKDASEKIISTAFCLSFISGSFFSLLLFLSSPLIAHLIDDNKCITPLRIMSVLLLIHSLLSVGISILTRELKFKIIGGVNASAYIVSSTVAITLAYCGYGFYAIVYQQIIYSVIRLILTFSVCVKIPKIQIYKKEAKEVLTFGGWLTLGVIFNNLTHQIDKLLMPRLLSINSLGAYNRPMGFVSMVSMKLNSIFDSVLFPLLSKKQDDKIKTKNAYLRSVSLLNLFAVILATFFFFNASLIIRIFFGTQWFDLVILLQITSISLIFNVDGRLVDCFFRSLGYVQLAFYLRIAGFIFTTALVAIGSAFDVLGVTIGLVISNVVLIIVKMIFLNKKIDCKLSILLHTWTRSWAIGVPIITISLLYRHFIASSLIYDIIFAFIYILVVLIILIFFPRFVGREYFHTIYPTLIKIINKATKHH